MTNYGTIPTSSSAGPSANIEYLSRAKERIKEGLADRRPWKLMFNIRSFNFPGNISDAISRVRSNVAYFTMNYAMIVLFILFLSLLWHPVSLIVFAAMMAAWLFLYFLRDEPLVVFRRTVDDRVVLIVLGVLTIVFLLLTDATPNILWSLLIGAVVVLVHASFRRTDDLYDEESTGLISSP
ncbi:PRA1 family protein F2 [Hibiscus syriacus]|uniref:PRA1 family protein n=1 Tax=Hibiscus syriacus TaxID=106335 RepID=A0A6A3BE68_HIBSY|nr:PRA1 family protein F3-like [Hibiscus syriacus]KAE8715114.1 PRA1 family protein F2 [Hibiscus syriacus]